jgi:ABC-type glycerol-3-phosphate transport system substrate-binding protein
MRGTWLGVIAAAAVLAACGGDGEEGPEVAPKDSISGVDAAGTADTEIFTNDPDTVGVTGATTPPPVAADSTMVPVPDSQRAHAP